MTGARVDRAAAAHEWLRGAEAPDLLAAETTAFAAIAQVHATLALAEQQRIANLIALRKIGVGLSGTYADADPVFEWQDAGFSGKHALRADVREALDLA